MNTVISKDGTRIAYDRLGSGPPLVLVDGAMCSRAFGPMPKLAPLLAAHFTVYFYDRRGRGASGDTGPYDKQREIEDLEALIAAAGGSAYVAGLSSGSALALDAAAAKLSIRKVAAYEPPYIAAAGETQADHKAALDRLIAADQRAAAVKYFMRDMVNVPGVFVMLMRCMPNVWPKLKAVAHTLPYDAAILGDFTVPAVRIASIRTPALIMDGGKTQERLKRAAAQVAAALPGATRRTLEGQTHNVSPTVLTAALVEFFN